MNRYNIPVTAEGLTAYAIERQNGWERHRPDGALPWAELRRFWTDAILQGMARLEGQSPRPHQMRQFDQQLMDARGSAAIIPASPPLQQKTIRNLRNYVSALETAGGDQRQQINVMRELLEDMASHLPWAGTNNKLDLARDEAEAALRRMTAQKPVRFTRILLGGDAGPHWASGFVSGSVTSMETVKQTAVYQDTVQKYPEVSSWPALCTVYVGADIRIPSRAVDASNFDLEIMNRAGDRFLAESGVCRLDGFYQMTILSLPESVLAAEHNPSIQYPYLQGYRPLMLDDLEIQERIGAEDGRISFWLDVLADETAVFGRQLSSEDEDTYLQAYTSYNEHTGEVDGTLDIVARSPGGDEWFSCILTPETRAALKEKLDTFCMEQYGERLPERNQDYCAPSQPELSM